MANVVFFVLLNDELTKGTGRFSAWPHHVPTGISHCSHTEVFAQTPSGFFLSDHLIFILQDSAGAGLLWETFPDTLTFLGKVTSSLSLLGPIQVSTYM